MTCVHPPAAQQQPDIISLQRSQQRQTHLLILYRHILWPLSITNKLCRRFIPQTDRETATQRETSHNTWSGYNRTTDDFKLMFLLNNSWVCWSGILLLTDVFLYFLSWNSFSWGISPAAMLFVFFISNFDIRLYTYTCCVLSHWRYK